MRQEKPYRERLSSEPDSSLKRRNRRLNDAIPFQWHHHPEYELTLTLNSSGQRFIGDHVGNYDDGDLVLVGPNLPHTWCSRRKLLEKTPHIALVIWFHPDWARQMTQDFVEFHNIKAMLARACRGLKFSETMTKAVRESFEGLFVCSPAERLLAFLRILHDLASDDAVQLSSSAPLIETPQDSRERIDRVLTHIHTHYLRPVSLAQIADIAALSQSGLHRLFLKHTGKSVSVYLTHIRIGDACARLSGTSQSIGYIADIVGYRSLANFNRQFHTLKGMTPREYRKLFA